MKQSLGRFLKNNNSKYNTAWNMYGYSLEFTKGYRKGREASWGHSWNDTGNDWIIVKTGRGIHAAYDVIVFSTFMFDRFP